MSNRILQYYQKHKNLVRENLNKSRDPLDIEAIHDMRLSIKRIRVVAKLAVEISNNAFNTETSLSELNKFFKASGRLRDIQVTKSLLLNLHESSIDPIIEQFNRSEDKQRKKYEGSMSSFRTEMLDEIELKLSNTFKEFSDKYLLMAGHAGAVRLASHAR